MRDERITVYLAFGLGVGIWYFFRGFMRFRRKRLIQNISTTTIRAMAMGLVEVIGKAKKKTNLKSPLTGTNCVFFKYLIQRYQRSGKSGRWVTIAKGDSSDVPFLLDDSTGSVLVSPRRAEYILPVDYEYKTGFGSPLPDNLINFMQRHNLNYAGFFGTYTLKFKEWYIQPDDMVYILGSAQKSKGFLKEHEVRLVRRLEELKQSPQKLDECDLNKDGDLSEEEWALARQKIEQEILEEEMKENKTGELFDVVIAEGDTEKMFIISDHSQKELIDKLFWQSLGGIYGGAALSIISAIGLLIKFGIIRCFQ
jgi:hypothetical protein